MDRMGLRGNFYPMESFAQFSHGADLSTNFAGLPEYVLAIKPNDELSIKLCAEKRDFMVAYKLDGSVHHKSHIVLATFIGKESMEDTISRWLRNICLKQKSFTITLNNYSGIPPESIYLRIMDTAPLLALAKELKIIDEFIRAGGCPGLQLVKRPQLTIARNLGPALYERAMADYSQKLFCESFEAIELVLLKRKDSYENFKTINVFGFLPDNNLFN